MIGRRALLIAGALLLIPTGAIAREPAPAPDLVRLAGQAHGIRAIREIKRLQHSWAHFAAAGQWEDMAALFARDATLTDAAGSATGRDAILAHIRATMGGGDARLAADRLNIRLMLSPVISIAADGRSAHGRWHEVAMIGRFGSAADWAGGIHENRYVLEDGVWRIAALRYHPQFAGPYAGGWRTASNPVPLTPYHYTPAGAGTPVPAGTVAPGAAPSFAAVEAESDLLLAASAVQNLHAAYGFYLDRKMWGDVADLFAPDGQYEIVGGMRAGGRAAIRRALDGQGPAGLVTGELNDRPQLMPIVTVAADGRSATVRAIEIGMTGRHRGASAWSAATVDTEFVRSGDRWRIASLRITPRMLADYERGWAAATPLAAAYPIAASARVMIAPSLAAQAVPGRGGPGDRMAETRRKLAVALAHDSAENISNAYGYYIDEFRWDDASDLFAIDGWKELSYIGTYIGRERVRESMVGRYGRGGRSPVQLAIHQKTQPFVTVAPDGQSAQIRLRLFQFNSAPDAPGSWISGIYENQAKIEDGAWKIHGMDLDYVWLGNVSGGWAAIDPEASKRFAPKPEVIARFPSDAPLRGVRFAPFPDIAPMGFHFRNPVSGRTPPLLLDWSDGTGR